VNVAVCNAAGLRQLTMDRSLYLAFVPGPCYLLSVYPAQKKGTTFVAQVEDEKGIRPAEPASV
jgi:hypothetical protein